MFGVDLDTLRYIGMAIIGLIAALLYGRPVLGFVKGLATKGSGPASLQDAAASVIAVRGYFESLGCKAGVEAANKCWACLVCDDHSAEHAH